jgi:hypothetical protein
MSQENALDTFLYQPLISRSSRGRTDVPGWDHHLLTLALHSRKCAAQLLGPPITNASNIISRNQRGTILGSPYRILG